jgi:tight adherence protein B
MMIGLLAAITAAAAVFVAIGALTGQFAFTERRLVARASALARYSPEGAGERDSASLLKDDAYSGSGAVSRVLGRLSWASSRAKLLDRANVPLKVSEYVLLLFAVFVAITAVITFTSGVLIAGLIFGVVGALIVETWLKGRARKRLQTFNKQLPLALQLMSTSLQSGFGILEAVQTVGREMEDPLAGEFTRIIDQARVGGSFESGLETMVQRMDSQDLHIVARALDIHRKVGGDLAAILTGVATTMREREELRGHVLALTAQQRLGGMIVGLLPLWVVGFFLVTNPDYISPLWTEPTGRILLAAGASMDAVAFVLMRYIMTIEV